MFGVRLNFTRKDEEGTINAESSLPLGREKDPLEAGVAADFPRKEWWVLLLPRLPIIKGEIEGAPFPIAIGSTGKELLSLSCLIKEYSWSMSARRCLIEGDDRVLGSKINVRHCRWKSRKPRREVVNNEEIS